MRKLLQTLVNALLSAKADVEAYWEQPTLGLTKYGLLPEVMLKPVSVNRALDKSFL